MANNFKIVLIALYDWNALGVRTLHSVLKSNHINVTSVFFKLANPNNTMGPVTKSEMDTLIRLLRDVQPTLVAISLRSSMYKLSVEITQRIKRELGILTLWGGFHPTVKPEQSLGYADLVCIGEGERPIVELCKRLSNGSHYDDVGNLWIKHNGTAIRNRLYPLIDNLDSIPFADFTNKNKYLIERGKILQLPDLDDRAEYDIMTARGCPFSCTYCCNNLFIKIYQGLGRIVRRRSVKNVIEELCEAKKTFKNLSYVYFYDDVFTMDKKWLEDFSCHYRNQIGLPFFCYTHPNFADDETFHILREAGLQDVTVGIQSGSERIRDTYLKRHSSNDKIIEMARIFRRYRINVSYDILLDNPFENDYDRYETLQLLLSLPRPFQLHTHTLAYFPETDLTKLALEKGMIKETDVEDQKQQALQRWTTTLDLARDKNNLFWDNLYYMAKKRGFPKAFILRLTKNRFLKNHPEYLTRFLKIFTYDIHSASTGRFKIIYLLINAFRMIFRGEFSRFKSHFKMFLKRNFE